MAAQNLFKPNLPKVLKRNQTRIDLWRSDGFSTYLKSGRRFRFQVKAIDLNCFGASIVLDRTSFEEFIARSEYIELLITLPGGQDVTFACQLMWQRPLGGESLQLGLKFIEQISPLPSAEQDTENQFKVSLDDVNIHGFFYKPFVFFERACFSIVSIAKDNWTIEVKDSGLFLFKEHKLSIFFVSSQSEISVEARVVGFRKTIQGTIQIDLEVKKASDAVNDFIGYQLLYLMDFSPLDLRKLGFDLKSVSNGFRFRFVKTNDEYEMVLKLRYKAYLQAGKINDGKTFKDMATNLDHLSRIIVAYHGDKLVASVAMGFPDDDELVLDTEQAFAGGYPEPMPKKTRMVEVARLCTDSDYRRTDLMLRVLEYVGKVFVCSDRDFIITSTDDNLWPLYQKVGFSKTGMCYAHPYLQGLRHHIIMVDRTKGYIPKKISPLAWNYIWRDLYNFLDKREMISNSLLSKAKVIFFLLIGNLLKIRRKNNY